MSAAPLADLRVIAVEQYGAGPWATMQLADLGAEVIKIEDPGHGGDVGRYVPPYQEGEDSLFFETFNRNKRSVSLDLRRPESRGVLEDLVHGADAIFSNLRGDQPERLGLRYEDLRAVNRRIVCCSLSGFGMDGPRRAQGAYDHTVQALAGWMSVTGGPDAPPTKSGLSLVDFMAGYVAALTLAAAVWRARRDGVGGDCDLALFDVALAQLNYLATWSASRGYVPRRMPGSAHPSMVPFQTFPTADGAIVVACPKQTLWERLCDALERPDLAAEPDFADFAARARARDRLVPLLEEIFRSRATAAWLELLGAHGVPCAPVNDVAAALADEQARARGALVEVDHPELGAVRQVASPLRISGHVPPLRRGPRRGEDTQTVLRELCGYEAARIEALASAGVFGDVVAERVGS